MSETSKNIVEPRKEAMKTLREARRDIIQAAALRVKNQKREMDAIREALHDGGRTVPELAGQTGMDSSTVLWFVATLKKYGEIVEGEKDGSYFRYELVRHAVETHASGAPSAEKG